MKKYKYSKDITFEGKRYKIRADTEKELVRKEILKLQELENGVRKIEKSMKFKDWALEWLETYKKPSISEESYISYMSCLKCHILPYLGNMQLKSVRAIHTQKVMNEMLGSSKKMINRIANMLYGIFETAKSNNLVLENPASHLIKPKGTVSRRRAITLQERKYILQVAEYHRAGLWVKLMLFCGLRPGETAALQWRNVDFKKKMLHVDSAVKRKTGVGSTKTEAGKRSIPIPEILISDLQLRKEDPFDYVLTNTKGGRLTSTSMQRMWDYFKNELNIAMGCESFRGRAVPPYRVADDLVPYCLRHTYCTDLQAAGVPINVARELMGHTDISVTSKIYTHSSDQATNRARDLINSLHATPTATPELSAIEK